MNDQTTPSAGQLPAYITSATPNPPDKRAPWYKTTGQTYAGIFLWFVFWDSMSGNGLSVGGLGASAPSAAPVANSANSMPSMWLRGW